MSKITLAEKKPDLLIAEGYVDLLTKGHPSCFGVMTLKKGGLLASCDTGLNTEQFMEVQKEGKQKPCVFMAGDFAKDIGQDDVQPFIMLGDEDEPTVLAMLEGDFSEQENKDTEHTDEYFVANEFLLPKVQQYAEMVDNDLDKLVTFMDKPLVHKELEALFDDKGVGSIFLMFANGAILRYIKPSGKQGEYDWGWTSNTLGYAPQQSVSATPTTARKKGLSLVQDDKGQPAAPPTPTTKPDVPGVHKIPDKPVVTDDPDAMPKIEGVWYSVPDKSVVAQCPSEIKGKDNRRDWYNKYAGFCPDGYRKTPAPTVKVSKTIKDFQELAAKMGAISGKDTGTHHIPESKAPAPVQLISAEAKKKLKDWLDSGMVQKIISGAGAPDPDVLNDIEKQYPTFVEVAGLDGLEQTFKWPYGIKVSLCTAHPESAALLIQNLTVKLLQVEADLDEFLEADDDKKPGESKTPGTGPQPAVKTAEPKRVKGGSKLAM